jgi:hypothetical protein
MITSTGRSCNTPSTMPSAARTGHNAPSSVRLSHRPETGFWAISLQLNDHTVRGVGGRQYGTSEDFETLQG